MLSLWFIITIPQNPRRRMIKTKLRSTIRISPLMIDSLLSLKNYIKLIKANWENTRLSHFKMVDRWWKSEWDESKMAKFEYDRHITLYQAERRKQWAWNYIVTLGCSERRCWGSIPCLILSFKIPLTLLLVTHIFTSIAKLFLKKNPSSWVIWNEIFDVDFFYIRL